MTHRFKEGDTIRVRVQPRNQLVPLVGKVGQVETILGDDCVIQTYADQHGLGGSGRVPQDCLEPYSCPGLTQAIKAQEAAVAAVMRNAELRRARWNDLVATTAGRFNLPIETVDQIMKVGREFE